MSDIHDELQPAIMAARLLSRRIRATGTVHRLFKMHLDTLEAQLAKLDAMRMQQAKAGRPVLPASALRPRTWTVAMSEAWHRAIPDTVKAFDDLIAAAEAGRAEGES